jgi:hypothetical protein
MYLNTPCKRGRVGEIGGVGGVGGGRAKSGGRAKMYGGYAKMYGGYTDTQKKKGPREPQTYFPLPPSLPSYTVVYSTY